MTVKKLMILGASILQLPAIVRAKELGLQVIAVDMDPEAVGFREEGVIREVISTNDIDGVLTAAKRHRIDGIVTICTDMPMRTVARVAAELGLPGISEEAAFRSTNKAAMRRCLAEHGVPVPKFRNVIKWEEYLDAVAQFMDEGRCVVKAADNSGSRGIKLLSEVRDRAEVEKAFAYCKEFSRSGELVVEAFMEGPEVCVETLNINGICYPIQITDQLAKDPPYFTDAGYSQPCRMSPEIQEEIRRVAIAANLALENNCGSSCTELIVTKDGPKVVEVGARLAGDCMTTHLVPLSTGVDMVEGVIRIALGEKPDIAQKWSKGAAIRYYMKPVSGVIKEIRGLEAARKSEGVQQVTIIHGPGFTAKELRSSGDRLGFVIAKGETAEEAVRLCEAALDKISFVVE